MPRISCTSATSSNNLPSPCCYVAVATKRLRECELGVRSYGWSPGLGQVCLTVGAAECVSMSLGQGTEVHGQQQTA